MCVYVMYGDSECIWAFIAMNGMSVRSQDSRSMQGLILGGTFSLEFPFKE